MLKGILVSGLAATFLLTGGLAPAMAAQTEQIDYHRYTAFDISGATFDGSQSSSGGLRLATAGLQSGSYVDPYAAGTIAYQSGSWTSPWRAVGFGFSELVASWNATTPSGTWIQVQMQAKTNQGALTKWYTMGIWASDASTIHRTSVGGQGDADGYIAIDTFIAKDQPMVAYRLAVSLFRRADLKASPTVRLLGAVSSNAPEVNLKPSAPSSLGGAEGIELEVPRLSQELHAGEYPEFDGGGEAWCSPTSTSMVVEFWKRGPTGSDLGNLPPSTDPAAIAPKQDLQVDFAATRTYDYHYQGTGNWPFNTAYAATFGLQAEVMQLHSLTEAEQFIKAGIPLVASMAFSGNQLSGFFLKTTAGHLLVISGFTSTGDVVVNDPAEVDDVSVRKVYGREQFERAWLGATGGIVYVIHPASVPLPSLN